MTGTTALGLCRELRTQPVRNRPRTSRRGQVRHKPVATSLASARPPRLASSPRATSCRNERHGHHLCLQVLSKEPEDHLAVAVSSHHDTPGKIGDLGKAGQPRLNSKLSAGQGTDPEGPCEPRPGAALPLRLPPRSAATRPSSSSQARTSSSAPSAASALRTLSGAPVPWSSTPRSSGGVSRVAGAANCLSSAYLAAARYRTCRPYATAGGRPLLSCRQNACRKCVMRRSLSCPACASVIRSASNAIAMTTGWKLPLLTSARSGMATSGLSQAAFSSVLTAALAAATYSRSAPCTWGTTRKDSASWTDRAPAGSSRALPLSSSRMWSAAAICPGMGLARPTAGCTIETLAPVASMDRLAARSAARAVRSALTTTSAPWPTDTPFAY